MQQASQTVIRFYLWLLLYMFLALILRLVAFVPLLALEAFSEGSGLRYLALLCPLLLIFIILPMRYSFADALVQRPGERCFRLDTAFSFAEYGEKLSQSLSHALHVFKWGLPLIAMLGFAYYEYESLDFVTLFKSITSLGKGLTDVWCAIANFFIGLFGGETLVSDGGLDEGLLVLAAALAIGLLIWLYGAVRNSAARFIWVTASREDRSPRKEARRSLRGRRLRQLGVALVNLVLWAPFLAVVIHVLKGIVSGMTSQLMLIMTQHSMPEFDFASAAWPLCLAFLLLYMPLLPIRRIRTAAFAIRRRAASGSTRNQNACSTEP